MTWQSASAEADPSAFVRHDGLLTTPSGTSWGRTCTWPPISVAWNATKCPNGLYPVGGGPSSSHAVWETQWSDADRSTPTASHPDEWTVSLLNNSDSTAAFKVFVVCSSASTLSGNY